MTVAEHESPVQSATGFGPMHAEKA